MDVFEILSSLLMLICSIFGTICALVFIIIIIINRQCHTVNNLLAFNCAVAGFIINITYICQSIYQLIDIGDDVLCPLRGFILHTGTGLLYHSLCVIGCYRLFVTVYSTRRFLQTNSCAISMVAIQWFISCTFVLPLFITGKIQYQVNGRVCEVPMEDEWGFIYVISIAFVFPLILIVILYIKIVKYMKQNPFSTKNRSNIPSQCRRQSELRLIRRICMIITTLFLLDFPKLISFIATEIHLLPPWPYMIRVDRLFITCGISATMFVNIIITDDVRKVLRSTIMKYIVPKKRVQDINVIKMPIV